MNYNNLTVKIRTAALANIPYNFYAGAQGIRMTTICPGGLYGAASFFIPWDISEEWPVELGSRVNIYNGLDKCVWEGALTAVEIVAQGGQTGYACQCQGYWALKLMRRLIHKMWADNRVDAETWRRYAVQADDKFTVDHQNRLRIVPKNIAMNQYDQCAHVYTAAPGETIKRLTGTAAMAEGAQDWRLAIIRHADGAILETIGSATGTAAFDHTLGTAAQSVRFAYYSNAASPQTPTADGTAYFAELTGLRVYTETGTITAREVAIDVQGIFSALGELSSSTALIGSLTYDLAPSFGADTPRSYADVLMDAVSYGDASNNTWFPYIAAADPNGDDKPRLGLAQMPALTGADYYISLEGKSLGGALRMVKSMDEIANWMRYQYEDEAGYTVFVSPLDDTTLKDSDSIAAYGYFDLRQPLSARTTSGTLAAQYARQYLERHKEAFWKISGNLVVQGYVRGAGGQRVPASEISAGRRLRVENYLEDLNGSGLTFWITATDYDDASETCSISVGKPDSLSPWLARTMRAVG